MNNSHQNTSMEDNIAHILHWLKILTDGPTRFNQAIAHNHHHPSHPPALFAMVASKSTIVKVVHGFATNIVQDKHHHANRCMGLFISDHIAAQVENGWHLQNPLLLATTHDWDTLLRSYDGSLAPNCTIIKSDTIFLPLTVNSNCHHIPKPHTPGG